MQTRLAEDGEILVKSPGRMAGYYKEPALTAESTTVDGYFRTGDLGRYDGQGLLELTGRKKELFKTAKGKYVAPAPIEGRLAAHPMIELALVAGSGQPAAHAMVMLDENLRPHAGEPWTMANGCLTPTMKIRRSRIEASVAGAVAAWYDAPGPVVWA